MKKLQLFSPSLSLVNSLCFCSRHGLDILLIEVFQFNALAQKLHELFLLPKNSVDLRYAQGVEPFHYCSMFGWVDCLKIELES